VESKIAQLNGLGWLWFEKGGASARTLLSRLLFYNEKASDCCWITVKHTFRGYNEWRFHCYWSRWLLCLSI